MNEVISQNQRISPSFQIHSVTWGDSASGLIIDITTRMGSLVQNETLTTYVGNDLAGHDPAPGMRKILVLDFTHNGVRTRRTWNEGDILKFP